MFIQTTHFLEDHHITNAKIRFAGQEKSENNQRLAIMNMVVHGLDATNIRQGNTFYDRQEALVGGCDFVMANPPFNVDAVDASKCQIDVLPDLSKLDPATGEMIEASALEKSNAAMIAKKRLPFGLSGVTKRKSTNNERTDGGADKNDVVSNANSLWIQYFYSYLNATGRAGFVMASSASDAGGKDKEIRQQLVETGHVDVMVSIGNKFFYTRSLPCTLWFFDKGKKEHLVDHVLMLDARSVYTVVSARSHVFSDAQLAAMTAIVHLNRGELDKYNQLLAGYLRDIQCQLNALPALVTSSSQASRELAALLSHFAGLGILTELNNVKVKKDKDGQLLAPPAMITEKQLSDYQDKIKNAYQVLGPLSSSSSEEIVESLASQYAPLMTLAQSLESQLQADVVSHADVVSAFETVLAGRDVLVALREAIVARHQDWLALVEEGEALRSLQSKAWSRGAITECTRSE
jgi:type I restriction enzyme M protein